MSYSSKLSAHYLGLAKTSISTESFAGEDVRFSSEYEVLESELSKAQSMHESGHIDWLKICENSETLLRTLSKDIRVGAWLTWGLYQRESFQGLLAGLGLLHHLCESHWAEIHPSKARTRSAAIGWLVPRLEQVLNENIAIKEQLPLFRRMIDHLEGLDAACTEHLGDDAPLLLPISRRLKNMVQRAADNQPEPGVVGAAVAQVKQAAAQLFNPGAPIDNEKEAHKALRAQQENARPLCAWWLKQKATDLRALRLNRTLLWLPIDTVPERNNEHITALRGLPLDKLKTYQDRYDQAKYADLIVELEASLAKAPFWFDGQRMVWECLQELNAEMALYFRDYANYWGEAVGRIALPTINDFSDGAEQLAGLTSANSPILQLLVEVRENTRFPVVAGAVDDATDAAGKLADKGGKLEKLAVAAVGKASDALVKKLPDTAKKSLQSRFDSLHRLLDDNNGPTADLIPALTALNDLQMQMASLARASSPEQAAFEMAKTRMGGQRDALSNLRNATGRLPRPVSVWFNVLSEDTWRLALSDSYRYLNQRYQSELYSFYGKAISKRYPFSAHSASDVAISDFREFFKAQGIADRFFDSYLRPFVSGDPGNYRMRSVDGHSLPISKVYLDQMAAALVIRQSFFAENAADPQVQFKLEPYTLDPAVSRSEFKFGDKTIEYRHGPIVPVSFKWPTDAEDGRTSLVLDKMVGRALGIEKNTGPWSLFRLFDLMQTEYLTGRDVLVLKADVGGLRANYLLYSQRTPNPFDMGVLRTFRMPVQL